MTDDPKQLSPLEQRVVDALDVDGLLAYLSELVAIPSLGGEETPAQRSVAARMERCGLAVDVWDIDFDALKRHPAFTVEIERDHGLGVVGFMGGSTPGRTLILNGHVDVVPAGDERNWTHQPFDPRVADGRVYGRGALDMKGGLCAGLFAAQAIRDSGVQLAGRLIVQSVIGEEDGGAGTLAAIARGYRADGAIVMEPTELAVAPVQAGALNFRVTVPGLSAHGCVREEGVSAIEKFIPVYRALMDLERERNERSRDPLYARYALPFALCVGTLRAGTWASSVAESLTFEGRYGVRLGEDLAQARREFEAAVGGAARADRWLKDHPPVVEWWGAQFEPGGIAPDHALVDTVCGAYRSVSGRPARVEGMTYGADLRLLVNLGGTPTVLFGPGDIRQAHRPDEFVPVADLVAVARTLAVAAIRFCGTVP